MTRRTSPAFRRDSDVELGMLIGPVQGDGLSDEDLELGWHYHGARLLEQYVGPATRPWGWWAFEAGEPKPDGREAEAVRLAELGELDDEELATLRERANEARLRVGTGRERVSGGALGLSPQAYSVDRRTVELQERVKAALRQAPRP